jgi:hypothetical protein
MTLIFLFQLELLTKKNFLNATTKNTPLFVLA